jgi:hypothetical protein
VQPTAAPMIIAMLQQVHGESRLKCSEHVSFLDDGSGAVDRVIIDHLRGLDLVIVGVGNRYRMWHATAYNAIDFDPKFKSLVDDPEKYGGDVLLRPVDRCGYPLDTVSGGQQIINSLPLEQLRRLASQKPVYALATGIGLEDVTNFLPGQLGKGRALQSLLYGGYVNSLVICDELARATLRASADAISRNARPADERIDISDQREALRSLDQSAWTWS